MKNTAEMTQKEYYQLLHAAHHWNQWDDVQRSLWIINNPGYINITDIWARLDQYNSECGYDIY